MRRGCVSVLVLLIIGSGCAPKGNRVEGVTGATPKFDAADARGWPEELPVEDASAWPEESEVRDAPVSLVGPAGDDPPAYIEVYTDKKSYLPGETINFHVSTTAETYSIEIYKDEWSRHSIAKVSGLAGSYYPTPGYENEPWVNGANWPVSYGWVVPDDWENGSYFATVRTASGAFAYAYHPFVVRTRVPGSRSKVVFVMNFNTRNAYNRWGGKSLYYTDVPEDSHKGVAVTFLRPFAASYGRGDNYWGQWQVISHLIAAGFDPEFVTEREIHFDPALLLAYDVVVFAGHHEYISRRIYDAIEAYHDRGGHLAFFSGNDLWWQVRYENDGEVMVGYRGYALGEDPMIGVDDDLVTTNWHDKLLNRPGQALQGVSYEYYSWCYEAEDYIVQDSNHFIFEGTGLENGDALGYKVAAGETDMPGPASPAIMDVVLIARRENVKPAYIDYVQVDHVGAAAVYYEDSVEYGFPGGKGGQVFAAGTHSGWGTGLQTHWANHDVLRIATSNIIQHMVNAPRPRANLQDLATAVSYWLGQCELPNRCEHADINFDGIIDMRDFAYLAKDWSK